MCTVPSPSRFTDATSAPSRTDTPASRSDCVTRSPANGSASVQHSVADQHRHRRSEAGVRGRHLRGHHATTDDGEPAGNLARGGCLPAGPRCRLAQTGDVRHQCAASGRDDDRVPGGERRGGAVRAGHLDDPVGGDPPLAAVQGDPRRVSARTPDRRPSSARRSRPGGAARPSRPARRSPPRARRAADEPPGARSGCAAAPWSACRPSTSTRRRPVPARRWRRSGRPARRGRRRSPRPAPRR